MKVLMLSFVEETIKPIIVGMFVAMKKQIAIMVAEVVSKAFLEHVYYEGEARRTNGEVHYRTTQRVNSVAKMSTLSINSCPFHPDDSTKLDQNEVQTEVRRRLQSSMTPCATTKPHSAQSDATQNK